MACGDARWYRHCNMLTSIHPSIQCTHVTWQRLDVINDLKVSMQHTGWMDTALLLPLGVIQIISSGWKTQRSPRHLLSYVPQSIIHSIHSQTHMCMVMCGLQII